MKAAHLTSVHPRYDTRILLKQCMSLMAHGYTISLVVADGTGDEVKDGLRIIDAGASRGRLERMCRAPGRVLTRTLTLDADIYQPVEKVFRQGIIVHRRSNCVEEAV